MRYAAIVLVSCVLLASSAVSQQSATASIEGIVTRLDTGAPVVGAQVTLTALPHQQIPPINTDSEGKFVFKNLVDGGTYNILVIANGFVRQQYGQRSVNGQGTPFVLEANQNMKDVALKLTATGTVIGRILDENGQPALGIPVQLLRAAYNAQGRVYQAVGTTAADDRGQYRMFGVAPGKYYLNIGNPPGLIRTVAPPGGLLGRPATGTVYASNYFPGVADVSQAVMIEVKSAQEVSYDMTAGRQQTYRVRGTLLDSGTGQPPVGNVQIDLRHRLLTGDSGTFGPQRNYDPATGTFELMNVMPGQYTVQARMQEPLTTAQNIAAQMMQPAGRTPITVTDADVEGVTVTLTTGVTIPGKVVLEGQAISALTGIDRIAVVLQLAQNGVRIINAGIESAPGLVGADGTFQLAGVREGESMVEVYSLSPGFYVKSIHYGGSDILNNSLKFSGSGSGSMDVIVRSGTALLSGVVSDARLQAVSGIQTALVPEQRNRTDLYRTATTDATGRFNFTNVTPGQYRVFSWEAFEPGMQFDPDFLKKYEQQGRLVQVAEASNQNLDVKIIPMN